MASLTMAPFFVRTSASGLILLAACTPRCQRLAAANRRLQPCVYSRGTQAALRLTACPATWHTCSGQSGSALGRMDAHLLLTPRLPSLRRDSATTTLTLWRRFRGHLSSPTTSPAATVCAFYSPPAVPRHHIRSWDTREHLLPARANSRPEQRSRLAAG